MSDERKVEDFLDRFFRPTRQEILEKARADLVEAFRAIRADERERCRDIARAEGIAFKRHKQFDCAYGAMQAASAIASAIRQEPEHG